MNSEIAGMEMASFFRAIFDCGLGNKKDKMYSPTVACFLQYSTASKFNQKT